MEFLESLNQITSGYISGTVREKTNNTQNLIDVKNVSSPEFFPSKFKRTLKNMLIQNESIEEVEAIFGRYKGRKFVPGVTINSFNTLLSYLSTQEIFEKKQIETIDIIVDGVKQINYNDGTTVYQKKIINNTLDIKQWGYRIKKSSEFFLNEDDVDKEIFNVTIPEELKEGKSVLDNKNITIRRKTRYTFIVKTGSGSIFEGVKLDLTFVIQDNGHFVRYIYEVEIERNVPHLNSFNFIKIIKAVSLLLNGGKLDINSDGDFIEEYKLISLDERNLVIRMWNRLFEQSIEKSGRNPGPFSLYNAKNKPVPIEFKDLMEQNDYVITVKYDGLRAIILFANFGTYIIDSPNKITKLNFIVPRENGTIIDGEFFENENDIVYYPFDILFRKGNDVRVLTFLERIKEFKSIKINKKNFTIEHKEFFHGKEQRENIKDARDEMIILEKYNFPTDGLIFQPNNVPYYTFNSTKKWKPKEKLTIDFLLLPDKDDPYQFIPYVMGTKNPIKFVGGRKIYDKKINIPNGTFRGISVSNQIVEMKWDYDAENFIIDRFRPDKRVPNYVKWAKGVWIEIHDPVNIESMIGEDMKKARYTSNIVKKQLLQTYFRPGEYILDIGSGRGGDLKKWKDLNLGKVIVVDTNEENLNILRERAERMAITNVEDILNIDAEDEPAITKYITEKEYGKMDGITAFFSLTFFGVNEKKMRNLIDMIDSNLKYNGYFICILLDGDEVKNEMGFDQSIIKKGWTIRKDGEWSEEFGNKIVTTINDEDSMVKNVEEYLFPFSIFKDIMSEKRIELEITYKLEDNKLLSEQQNEFMKMNRVAVFKKLEPRQYPNLMPISTPGDVKELQTPFNYNIVRVGTIGEGSCFFHSVLTAFNKKYRKMDEQQKMEFVSKLRKSLADRLDMDTFSKLGNGILLEFMENDVIEESPTYRNMTKEELEVNDEEIKEKALNKYKNLLGDCKEWVGETSLEYVSNKLKLDIYIMSDKTRNVKIAADCNNLYKNRASIIVLNIDNVHYETVGIADEETGRVKLNFEPDNSFIKQLYKEVCN